MSVGLLLSLANLLARSFICSFAALYIILLLALIVQQRLSMQELHFKNLRIARKFRLNLRVVIPLFLVLLISVFFYVGLADYLIPRIQSVFSNTDEFSNARIDSALYFLQNMFKISHFGGSGLKDKRCGTDNRRGNSNFSRRFASRGELFNAIFSVFREEYLLACQRGNGSIFGR